MCIKRKRIYNRTKLMTDGTVTHFDVNCNDCPSCRSKKHEDMFQRIMAEFADCSAHGGKVLFCTLTYNEEHIPRFSYTDKDGNRKSFYVFSRQDKIDFLHDLNQYFVRQLGVRNATLKYPFKCFWPCEYGMSENGTHRPHYHPLFFIPKEYLDSYSHNYYDWIKLVKKFWEDYPHCKGFVRQAVEKKNRDFVKSDYAALYASKYVGKDIDFYNHPDVKEYMRGVKRSKSDVKYQAIKDKLPKCYKSMEFGASLGRFYDNEIAFCEGIDFSQVIPLRSETDRGKVKRRFMPVYIKRKLYYERDSFGREVMTDRGRKFSMSKLNFDKERKTLDLLSYCDEGKIRDYVKDDDLKYSSILQAFGSISELCKFIRHIVHSDEIAEEMALYSICLTSYNSWYNKHYYDDLDCLLHGTHDDFVNCCYDIRERQLFASRDDLSIYFFDDNGVFSDKCKRSVCESSDWLCKHPLFASWNLVLNIIEEINSFVVVRNDIKYQMDRNIRRIFKNKVA